MNALQQPQVEPNAYALRPVRIVNGQLREYEAVTFPGGPWRGCAMWLRRCWALGYLGENYAVVDVLDRQGDIIQDFGLNRRGFKYLQRQLKFRVVE
jgi:hypothetical protein